MSSHLLQPGGDAGLPAHAERRCACHDMRQPADRPRADAPEVQPSVPAPSKVSISIVSSTNRAFNFLACSLPFALAVSKSFPDSSTLAPNARIISSLKGLMDLLAWTVTSMSLFLQEKAIACPKFPALAHTKCLYPLDLETNFRTSSFKTPYWIYCFYFDG